MNESPLIPDANTGKRVRGGDQARVLAGSYEGALVNVLKVTKGVATVKGHMGEIELPQDFLDKRRVQ